MVKRTKPEGVFYGLRLHMNTDQTITFWSKTEEALQSMVQSFLVTLQTVPSTGATIPGQLSKGNT
jgi:hypothetical protein